MNEKKPEPPEPSVGERSASEALMDEILEETFPASDPPAWGSVAARVDSSRPS
jgi:hypothetical protein